MADPTPLAEVAALLPGRVERHYGRDQRVNNLEVACRPFTTRTQAVDVGGLAELQIAAQTVFRHLELRVDHNLELEERSRGWSPPDLDAARRTGAGVSAVRRHPDGTAVIELIELAQLEAAAPVLRGVFAVVDAADRVGLDLRRNGGGDPATAVFIIDWLAGGPPRHVFNVRYADHMRQWWTAGATPSPQPGGLVQVLIGRDTYSSGEALAWALQAQCLAELVGEPTRGAADHVVPLALTHDVSALIPEAAVLTPENQATWEGAGVQPDQPADVVDLLCRPACRHRVQSASRAKKSSTRVRQTVTPQPGQDRRVSPPP